MRDRRNDLPDPRTSSEASASSDAAELYASYSGSLQNMLIRAFELPEDAAESILERVFGEYTVALNRPPNPRGMLALHATTLARQWRKAHGLAEEPVGEKARRAVEMRFSEGRTYEEIADELDVTVAFAKHLVTKASRPRKV